MEDLVKAQQFLLLAFEEAADGDGCPAGDDVRDLLLGDDLAQQPASALLGREPFLLVLQAAGEVGQAAVAQFGGAVEVVGAFGFLGFVAGVFDLLAQGLDLAQGLAFGLPLGAQGVGFGAQVGQFAAQFLQPGLAGGVLFLGQGCFLDLQAPQAAGEFVQFGRHGVDLGAQHGAGFVDEVDGLVGQEPVGDVAVGEGDGGDQGAVLDLDAVKDLQAFAQATQDGDRVLLGRLVDHHGLEAAFQGGVLLDVLAVLVHGGGADHVQLAARQHRLEHVACVHRPFGGARADDGVEFVDEEQDAALGCGDLVQHGLEAFLELAAVLGARDQGAHVQGEDRLVAQALGYVPVGDALGQALGYGGLADAGVADEDGVVLGLAGQDLHDPADLGVAPDDGVEFAGAGVGDQVAAVLGQCLVRRFRGC